MTASFQLHKEEAEQKILRKQYVLIFAAEYIATPPAMQGRLEEDVSGVQK